LSSRSQEWSRRPGEMGS